MGRVAAVGMLLLAMGCAGADAGLVKPSSLDPGLASLDGEKGRSLTYRRASIERFDGFLDEAARVEATIDLARRLGGELRAAVLEVAAARDVPRADRRAWTALARELAARDDLTPAECERLRERAGPLAALLPHLGAVQGRAARLATDGAALIEGADRGLTPDEAERLSPALDALNVAVVRLREAGARAPNLAAEIGQVLDAVAALRSTPS